VYIIVYHWCLVCCACRRYCRLVCSVVRSLKVCLNQQTHSNRSAVF